MNTMKLETFRDEHVRLLEKQVIALRELQSAVLELRKSWIAPHRFNRQKAETLVAEISDKLQENKI